MKDILRLKNTFNTVKDLRSDIMNIFESLNDKLSILKKIYTNFLDSHHQSCYMFGIDSFYFQNKLIEQEINNLKRTSEFIENRMYCEYYQLHLLVEEYVKNEVTNENVRNKICIRKKYPPYKILEPNKKYDFKLIVELHEHIINSIMELESYRQEKETELASDTAQSKQGLNIGNLVNSYRFYNALLHEKIRMFIGYLEVFYSHHTKYFTRLHVKTKLVIGIINEDIKIKQFNPTENTISRNISRSPSNETDSISSNGDSEETSIKNFVNYEDEETGLKDALESIVSNISCQKSDVSNNEITSDICIKSESKIEENEHVEQNADSSNLTNSESCQQEILYTSHDQTKVTYNEEMIQEETANSLREATSISQNEAENLQELMYDENKYSDIDDDSISSENKDIVRIKVNDI